MGNLSSLSAAVFDGPLGRMSARIMARSNRDTEAEAVAELAPAPDHRVLVIGFGPGIGVHLLAERVPRGMVVGVDPSAAMHRAATRHNRAAIDAGLVVLHRATARTLSYQDGSFDGAITVNTIQLWRPFDETVAEVARVLRPGARLVSFTHDWAIERGSGRSVGEWVKHASGVCERFGLRDVRHRRANAESGRSVVFTARRD